MNRSPARPLLAVPNVTAYPSTASVPITVLLYNGPLFCGFNVPIKGLFFGYYNICFSNCKAQQSKRKSLVIIIIIILIILIV